MSGNATTNSLPPVLNPPAIIGPQLQSLMIGHTFLVLLIPLLAALLYYSTPYSRRQTCLHPQRPCSQISLSSRSSV